MSARSTAPGSVSLIEEGGDLVIDAAWLTLSDVAFREAESCRKETESEPSSLLTTPVSFDLLAGTTAFKLALHQTEYCEIRLNFDAANVATGDQPGTLLDAALVVHAHRSDGVPVEALFPDALHVKLDAESAPFALSDTQDALLISMDLSEWFIDLDLDGEEPDDDGVIGIDGTEDDDLSDTLTANLEASISLHYDLNGNGVLDANESAPLSSDEEAP